MLDMCRSCREACFSHEEYLLLMREPRKERDLATGPSSLAETDQKLDNDSVERSKGESL